MPTKFVRVRKKRKSVWQHLYLFGKCFNFVIIKKQQNDNDHTHTHTHTYMKSSRNSTLDLLSMVNSLSGHIIGNQWNCSGNCIFYHFLTSIWMSLWKCWAPFYKIYCCLLSAVCFWARFTGQIVIKKTYTINYFLWMPSLIQNLRINFYDCDHKMTKVSGGTLVMHSATKDIHEYTCTEYKHFFTSCVSMVCVYIYYIDKEIGIGHKSRGVALHRVTHFLSHFRRPLHGWLFFLVVGQGYDSRYDAEKSLYMRFAS